MKIGQQCSVLLVQFMSDFVVHFIVEYSTKKQPGETYVVFLL